MITGPKRGDLEPPLVIDIASPGADLTDVVSWRLICVRRGSTGIFFTDTSPIVVPASDTSKATVTHNWVDGQTDTAGIYLFEIEAMWPSARPQTFPSKGQVEVQINGDLDGQETP